MTYEEQEALHQEQADLPAEYTVLTLVLPRDHVRRLATAIKGGLFKDYGVVGLRTYTPPPDTSLPTVGNVYSHPQKRGSD